MRLGHQPRKYKGEEKGPARHARPMDKAKGGLDCVLPPALVTRDKLDGLL